MWWQCSVTVWGCYVMTVQVVMCCNIRSPTVRWRWARRPVWIASQSPASPLSPADHGGCRPDRTLSPPDLPVAPLPPPPPAHTDHWEDPSAGLINRVRPHTAHPPLSASPHNVFIFRFLPVPRQRYCSLDPLTWREETNISYLIIICQSLCDWYHHNVLCLIKQILISSYQTESILNIILKY